MYNIYIKLLLWGIILPWKGNNDVFLLFLFFFKGVVSKDLMEVSVDIIDTRVCNSRDAYGGLVTNNMLCAGKLEGGKDSCQVSSQY